MGARDQTIGASPPAAKFLIVLLHGLVRQPSARGRLCVGQAAASPCPVLGAHMPVCRPPTRLFSALFSLGRRQGSTRLTSPLDLNVTISRLSVPSRDQTHRSWISSASVSSPRPAKSFRPLRLLTLALLLGGTLYLFSTPAGRGTLLNKETFVPYTISSRHVISPTSVVLTVLPSNPASATSYTRPDSSLWRFGLWCVEFKQPQVQIARHYTPLPPLQGEDSSDGRLRFYIRAVEGGEMSGYLSQLPVGHPVWLRGPHTGFDILARLGSHSRVVFLAAGTGIVPGMQVAKAVLGNSETATVSLLWAVRTRDQIQSGPPAPKPGRWFFSRENAPAFWEPHLENPSPVSSHLEDLKRTYGDRLQIKVSIDEEGSRFLEKDVRDVLVGNPPASQVRDPDRFSDECVLHSQKLLEQTSEFEKPGHSCSCVLSGGAGPGKNLLFISGPEGFVAHYAGPKLWRGGALTQGPIGGVMAQVQKRHPALSRDWLVLKL